MPLIKCGDKSWKWGQSGHCYDGPNEGENKRKAIIQGVSYEGSHKVNRILQHSKSAYEYFHDKDGINLAKATLRELSITGQSDTFIKSIASYFTKSDPGMNSSDTDRGTILDGDPNKGPARQDHVKVVENAGDLSGNPQKTGDGLATGADEYGKHPNGPDNDGDEPDPEKNIDIYDPANNDASLDKSRDSAGKIVVPPYNKCASPETETTPIKDGNSPYPVVTRDELDNTKKGDNRQTLDPKLQYKVKSADIGDQSDSPLGGKDMEPDSNEKAPRFSMGDKSESNLYQNKEKDASEASVTWDANHKGNPSKDAVCDDKSDVVYDPQDEPATANLKIPPFDTSWAAEFVFGYISSHERDSLDESVFMGPHKSFPLRGPHDIPNIARLLHHGTNPSEIKRKTIERANKMGWTKYLPESWKKPDQKGEASAKDDGNLEWEENAGKNGDK